MSKCLICESKTSSLTDSHIKNSFVYVIYHVCQSCGFTFKDSRFRVDPLKEKEQYDFHDNSFENPGYVEMFKRFIAAAIDPFITTGKVLEFGSGPGPVLGTLLKEKGFDVSLYDPFYEPNEAVFKEQYDLITSTEVFEHFFEPLKTLETLLKSLKKDGFLAVMTSFRVMSDEAFLTWWYRRDSTHVSFYTLEAFEEIEKRFNLERLYTNEKNYIVFKKR